MTLSKMVIEVFDNLGRPTDIMPLTDLSDNTSIDITLPGFTTLANWINQGYELVARWGRRGQPNPNYAQLIKRSMASIGPHTVTGVTTVVSSHLLTMTDTEYLGYIPPSTVVVRITDGTGEGYESVGYFLTSTTIQLFTTMVANDGTSVFEISERGFYWSRFITAPNIPYAIRAIRSLEDQVDTELAARVENFSQSAASLGEPTSYFKEGDYIFLDTALDDDYHYEIEYEIETIPMSALLDEPVIPKVYHPPMVLWASYLGKLRYGENTDAYSFSGFFDTQMKLIVSEKNREIERLEGGFTA